MSLYVVLLILILLFIYAIYYKKKIVKEQLRIKILKENDEILRHEEEKRKEFRKKKLDDEKRLIKKLKEERFKKNSDNIHVIKSIEELDDLIKQLNKDSNNEFNPLYFENYKYYLEKRRILDRQIEYEKENITQINSNLKYYKELIQSIENIEFDIYENEFLFKKYLKSLKCNSNNILFRNSYKYNIKYYFLYDYMSNYTFNNLQNNVEIYNDVRKLIFNFKEGIFNDNLTKIISFSILKEFFDVYNNKDYYICVIPASNVEKNINRYDKILKNISNELKINNGFNLIKRDYSIQASLQNGVKNNINVLEGISFSNEIKGKNIILLDDVITKGSSLYNFYKKLNELGVNKIYPIFIGKTYYTIDKILDELDLEYNYNNISFLNQNISSIKDILKVENNNGNK